MIKAKDLGTEAVGYGCCISSSRQIFRVRNSLISR